MIGDYKKDEKLMNKIYLIDFGVSHSYLQHNGEHIRKKKNCSFKGNLIFSSKNAFKKFSLSRRDDLISLMHMLIFLVNNSVAYVDLDKPIVEQFD